MQKKYPHCPNTKIDIGGMEASDFKISRNLDLALN
jgi:hypothetical protein